MPQPRATLLFVITGCSLCVSPAEAELITALVTQDTFFYDRFGGLYRTGNYGAGDVFQVGLGAHPKSTTVETMGD